VENSAQPRRISRVQLGELQTAILRADKVARQSQQIARLGEGRLRQSHERVWLDKLVDAAINDRLLVIQRAGIELTRNVRPVEVIVDPSLLSSLLDAAMDWAVAMGQHVTMSLAIKNWPEHAQFVIRSRQTVVSETPPDLSARGDVMDWQLLVQLARAMGVSLEREFPPGEAVLTLEFSRTVRQLEGMSTMELETGDDSVLPSSFQHSGSRPLAGHRLLVVSADPLVRAEVQKATALLGLVIDVVSNSSQAVRCAEMDRPHMLLLDERLRDAQIDALVQDLKRDNANFGVLEVADDANTFAMAGWTNDTHTRISRERLRTQLSSLLTLELAKSF